MNSTKLVNMSDCPPLLSLYALHNDFMLVACGNGGLRTISLGTGEAGLFLANKSLKVSTVAFEEHTGTMLFLESAIAPDVNNMYRYWLGPTASKRAFGPK